MQTQNTWEQSLDEDLAGIAWLAPNTVKALIRQHRQEAFENGKQYGKPRRRGPVPPNKVTGTKLYH